MNKLLFSLVALVALTTATTAHADIVWSSGAVPGSGWALQTDPSALSNTASGSDSGVTGTAFGAVSLSEGFLKASVSSTATPTYVGTSISRVGLSSVIALSGPQDVGGVVAVTMTFDGTWGGPGANQSWVQMQSGPGFDGVGFASSNQPTMGLFSYIDNLLYGDRVDQCINCTYTLGDKFTFAITSFLPFLAGAQTVQYAAQIEISTQGAFIDGSHTATFSIDVPNGFTYSSALNFTDSIGSVPEPATLALVGFALAAIPAASARRRRR